MIDVGTLALFAAASAALIALPGPAVSYILAATLRRGRGAGLAAVTGIVVGDLVHVSAAVLGLSALLASSATAFTVVKVAGAAWLLALAVRTWRAATPGTVGEMEAAAAVGRTDPAAQPRPDGAATVRGAALVGVLNPKIAVFFLAFLPQFVRPDAGPAWGQMLVLGLCFTVMACLGNIGWTVFGAAMRRLVPNLRLRVLDRLSAGVYAAIGAATLAARRAT